jgi:hypothetical protein
VKEKYIWIGKKINIVFQNNNKGGCKASYEELFEQPKINENILNWSEKRFENEEKHHLEFTPNDNPKSYV